MKIFIFEQFKVPVLQRFMGGREFKKKDSMWGLRSCMPPSFPSALSKKALNALKEWNCALQDV